MEAGSHQTDILDTDTPTCAATYPQSGVLDVSRSENSVPFSADSELPSEHRRTSLQSETKEILYQNVNSPQKMASAMEDRSSLNGRSPKAGNGSEEPSQEINNLSLFVGDVQTSGTKPAADDCDIRDALEKLQDVLQQKLVWYSLNNYSFNATLPSLDSATSNTI